MERTDLYAMAAQLKRLPVPRWREFARNDIAARIETLASDLQDDEHNAAQARDEQRATDERREPEGEEE